MNLKCIMSSVIFVTIYPLGNLLLFLSLSLTLFLSLQKSLFRLNIINFLWQSMQIVKAHNTEIGRKNDLMCEGWRREVVKPSTKIFFSHLVSLTFTFSYQGMWGIFSLHIDIFMYSSVTTLTFSSEYYLYGIHNLIVTLKHCKRIT